MLSDPCSRDEFWEALDRAISESGKNRGQIVAHWEFQSAVAFHHRKNRYDLRSRLRASHVDPIFSPDCDRPHGVLTDIGVKGNSLRLGLLQSHS